MEGGGPIYRRNHAPRARDVMSTTKAILHPDREHNKNQTDVKMKFRCLLLAVFTLSSTAVKVVAFSRFTITRRPTPSSSVVLSSSDNVDVSSLLYQEHEKMLVSRGQLEGELMAHHCEGIAANVVKGAGSGGGFGAKNSSTSKKNQFETEGKAHAKVLRNQGVVRIDNVLPVKLADEMRAFVDILRQDSQEK